MHYASRIVPVGLLALIAAACADTLDAPTASRADPEAPLAVAGALRDREIDRGDTHYSATVITTTQVMGDAIGAANVDPGSVASTERTYIEAGYSRDGSIRYGVWLEDAARSPGVGSVRLAQGNLTIYDRRGAVLQSAPFADMMAWAGLPTGSVAGAFLPSTPPLGGLCGPMGGDCLAASAEALPQGLQVSDQGDLREIVFRPDGLAAAGAGMAEVRHRYRRLRQPPGQPEVWRLEETEQRMPLSQDGGVAVMVATSRMEYRVWHRNPGRERARAEASVARGAPSAASSAAPLAAPAQPVTMLDRPAAAGTVAQGFDLGGACRTSGESMLTVREQRGADVLYQHGFCSDASVWPAFDARLEQLVPLRTSRAFNIPSQLPIEDQVTALRGELLSRLPTRLVVVGHSQGGLVARRFGQRFPDLVRGVITIGSPHRGSYLADTGAEVAEQMLRNAMRLDCYAQFVCDLVRELTFEIGNKSPTLGLADFVPSVEDLRSDSPFQRMLNSTAEPFPRVSVEAQTPKRWVLFRLLGDRDSPSNRVVQGLRPRGDNRVTDVQKFYSISLWAHRASAAFLWYKAFQGVRSGLCDQPGFDVNWLACTDPNAERNWDSEIIQTTLALITWHATGVSMKLLDRIDDTWDQLTTRRSDDSDGLIHARSQRYPDVPGTHPPLRLSIIGQFADSHAGQTKSPPVVISVVEAIGYIDRSQAP